MKIIAIFFSGVVVTLIALWVFISSNYNYTQPNPNVMQNPINKKNADFVLKGMNTICDTTGYLTIDFKFIASNASFLDPYFPIQILWLLDSIYPGNQNMEKLFYDAFTTKLISDQEFDSIIADDTKLLNLIKWCESIKSYGNMSDIDKPIFLFISDYWLGKLSEVFSNIVDNENYNRYSYRYRFYTDRLNENLYKVTQKEDALTKVIDNIISNRYAYLWNRFLIRTSILFKIFVGICFSFIVFCVFYTLYMIIRKLTINRP
jgi:hypothetical protein